MANIKKLVTYTALVLGVVGLVALTGFNQVVGESASQLYSQLNAQDDQEVMQAYISFIAEFGKVQSSHQKHSEKYEVFKSNYKKIKHHNEQPDMPFVMSVNHFTDMTDAEFQKLLGVEIPRVLIEETVGVFVQMSQKKENQTGSHKHRHHHHNKTRSLEQSNNLAVSVNWNEKGAVSQPKDQGSCGSCWAFTTAATMESLAVISGQFKEVPSFSMQQLLDCDKSNDGCDGGWMYKAYAYTSTHGLMDYDGYAYKGVADHNKCLFDEKKVMFKNVGMKQEKSLSNDALKAILMKQPVGVGIFTNSNFQFYKSGVMTEETLKCSSPDNSVNHGVTVVGYGKSATAEEKKACEEYWVVRNSWGSKWGEEGFFKLCMDGTGAKSQPYGICQLNRFPTYPTMDAHPVETEILYSE